MFEEALDSYTCFPRFGEELEELLDPENEIHAYLRNVLASGKYNLQQVKRTLMLRCAIDNRHLFKYVNEHFGIENISDD